MTLLTNSFEGITPSGTVPTVGNSGGVSGNALDVVFSTSSTVQSDSAHAAHGSLGLQFATGGAAANYFVEWSTSMGTLTQAWFRFYLYLTANPASEIRFFEADPAAGAGGIIKITTTGKVAFADSASTDQITSTASLTLNAWNRIEGFVLASATVGQLEFKLFLGANSDGVTPDETKTSAATLNTGASLTRYIYGNNGTAAASFGPVWMDDLGLSSTGYPGPSVTPAAGIAPQPGGRVWRRRFRRVQQFPPGGVLAAAAAVAPAPVQRPALPVRPPGRARLGARGALAAGILAAGIGPPAVPAPHQPPAVAHPAPHRAQWRGGHGVVPAAIPQPFRPVTVYPRAARRALWRSGTGPLAAQATLQPFRPVTVYRRTPHRALWRGETGPVAVLGALQPFRPPTVFSRLQHRALWRGIAGPVAAAVPPQLPRPVTVYRRVLHGAVWKGGAGRPSAAAPQPFKPVTVYRRAPHGAAWRAARGQPPAATRQPRIPATVFSRLRRRAAWRGGAGSPAAPPPPFTVGALTAATTPTATLAATGTPTGTLTAATSAPAALTAATASAGTAAYGPVYGPGYGPQEGALTATDTRTGGPA